MSPELTALIIVGGLVLFLVLGAEIAVAMGIMSVIGVVFFMNQSIFIQKGRHDTPSSRIRFDSSPTYR